MANVAIFELNKIPQYLESINTPDYIDNLNALINPDITAVKSIPLKYWKRDGDSIVAMTQAEKDAVSAAELIERKAQADSLRVVLDVVMTALIKVINIRLPAGSKITRQELIDAVKGEIV